MNSLAQSWNGEKYQLSIRVEKKFFKSKNKVLNFLNHKNKLTLKSNLQKSWVRC